MYDKTQFYKEVLSPRLKEIFDLCVAEGMLFLGVAVARETEESAELYTTQVVKAVPELPATFAVLLEVLNNPEYQQVCAEILDLQLIRKALALRAAEAESAGETLQ